MTSYVLSVLTELSAAQRDRLHKVAAGGYDGRGPKEPLRHLLKTGLIGRKPMPPDHMGPMEYELTASGHAAFAAIKNDRPKT